MPGLTDYTARKALDHIIGKTAIFALPAAYVAAFTAVGLDDGSGFTEVTGGSYARVATAGADWNAAAASGPSSNSNANAIVFPTATADWGTVIAWGLYDAPGGGNLLAWDYLGSYDWRPFSCTQAAPGTLTVPAHGFGNGDKIVVTAEFGGMLPTTGGSWSGLLPVANVMTDTFTAGVNTTSTGSGLLRKVTPQSVPTGVTFSFAGGAPGNLVLSLA